MQQRRHFQPLLPIYLLQISGTHSGKPKVTHATKELDSNNTPFIPICPSQLLINLEVQIQDQSTIQKKRGGIVPTYPA